MLARSESILLFLVLLFLPTQLGKHFWFDFSFVYSLPIDYLSPTIYFWDLLVVSLLGVFLIQRLKLNNLALNLLLFFLLTQLFSLIPNFNNPDLNVGAGLFLLEQYMIAGLFGVYIASKSFDKISRLSFTALLISLLSQSLLGISQVVLGKTIGLWIIGERSFSISTPGIAKFDLYGQQWLRPYGTFPHPNTLAGYLSIVPVLLLTFGNVKRWFGVGVVAVAFTLFLTVSRTALFSGVGILILLVNKRFRIWILAMLIVALPVLYARYSALIDFDSLSFLRREQLNSIAFSVFLNSPLFGVGLNNFINSAADQLLVGPSRFLQPVHNIFLLILSETGVIGSLGFISLFIYPVIKLKTNKHFMIIFGSIFFLGLFDHYFLTQPQGYRLLFIVWGFAISYICSKMKA